jgi:Flp pilus assembly pilin Flp
MMKRVMDSLKRLHADERGAEGLEKLLIIAAIVLPLLGLLIIFRDAIKDWVSSIWEEARDKAGEQGDDYFGDDVPQGTGTGS